MFRWARQLLLGLLYPPISSRMKHCSLGVGGESEVKVEAVDQRLSMRRRRVPTGCQAGLQDGAVADANAGGPSAEIISSCGFSPGRCRLIWLP